MMLREIMWNMLRLLDSERIAGYRQIAYTVLFELNFTLLIGYKNLMLNKVSEHGVGPIP